MEEILVELILIGIRLGLRLCPLAPGQWMFKVQREWKLQESTTSASSLPCFVCLSQEIFFQSSWSTKVQPTTVTHAINSHLIGISLTPPSTGPTSKPWSSILKTSSCHMWQLDVCLLKKTLQHWSSSIILKARSRVQYLSSWRLTTFMWFFYQPTQLIPCYQWTCRWTSQQRIFWSGVSRSGILGRWWNSWTGRRMKEQRYNQSTLVYPC